MHCNLRPPDPRQSFSALITTPCQVWSHWTYLLPYYSGFCCWYITLRRYAVTLTFDLKHLQCIARDVMKLYTKLERNRAIRGGVIAISVFSTPTGQQVLYDELLTHMSHLHLPHWSHRTFTVLPGTFACFLNTDAIA